MKVDLKLTIKGKPSQSLKGDIYFSDEEREFLMVSIGAIGTLKKLTPNETINWGRMLFKIFNESNR